MLDKLKPMQHMPSAFKKCGLCPLDPEKAVERIPHVLSSVSIAKNVDSSLLKKLETERFDNGGQKKTRGKLSVPAGRSYTNLEEAESEMESEEEFEVEMDNPSVTAEVSYKELPDLAAASDALVIVLIRRKSQIDTIGFIYR
jgi:hypothetical protein